MRGNRWSSATCSSIWSRERDKIFESGLAFYSEDRWEDIAAHIYSWEICTRHQATLWALVDDDICEIESGCVPLPSFTQVAGNEDIGKKGDEKWSGGSWRNG